MVHSDFVHLRVRSAYSLSEGALKVGELVELTTKYKMPAVAVTDRNNLFGALEFAVTASGAGVQPIVGTVLSIRREEKTQNGQSYAPDELLLLAQNREGYLNLMDLVTTAFLEGDANEDTQVSFEKLSAHSAGLIAFVGAPNHSLGRLLFDGQDEAALADLERFKALFSDRLYMEVMRHESSKELAIEEKVIELAYQHDIPLIATNDVHFKDAGMYEAHDVLLCIAQGTTISDEKRRRLTPEHGFKSARDMQSLFADLPEAIANTMVVAQRCAFMPETHPPILPAFDSTEGRSEADELRAQALEGLEARFKTSVWTEGLSDTEREEIAIPYRERLDFELKVIEDMGFPGYFLIVADFIYWSKSNGIPVGPGRGSGAGSVVAWALTITDLDPLRFGLLFERFLNPERVSMPDFDIDFCQDRRDEVIRYVRDKYGADRVAQIITFGKLQARAALRDVGRVLQMPYGQIDRISKMVPNNPAKPTPLYVAVESEEGLRNLRQQDPQVRRLIDIAMKLEGLYRHASTHAAGVVIGDRPLKELVALYRDPRSDMPATQFNMKWVEPAGLVKFDFLGLKTLTVLAKAKEHIERNGGSIDLENLPLDDTGTFDMLSRGDAVGVFQLESSGMRDVLKNLKPDRFEDIIAVVALYRPGPMDNIPAFIRRKHGEEEVDCLHELLEPILLETYGIMIYQEQVMQSAQLLAGYSLGGADLLRRAMGKKIKSEMDAQQTIFVKGSVENGVDKKKAAEIFKQVEKFAGYGFNKSHAAAYALVAYQTAYLKYNYPVEFMAASMTYDMNNTDKLAGFKQELERLNIDLLPPSINSSLPEFSVEVREDGTKAVRYALSAIKNVGGAAMLGLVNERIENGPFKTISDFTFRLDPRSINKRLLENLIRSGSLDCVNGNRRMLIGNLEEILKHAAAAASEKASGQIGLFGDVMAPETQDIPLNPIDDWSSIDRLRQEFEAVGFYLAGHPLADYETSLKKLKIVTSQELMGKGVGVARVKLAGLVMNKQERTSAKGNRFAFVQLSDTSGVYEVALFSDALSASREFLETGTAVLITGDFRVDDEGGGRLTAQKVEPLEPIVAQAAMGLRIFVEKPEILPQLKSVIEQGGRGRGRVSLVLTLNNDDEAEIDLPETYQLNTAIRAAVKSLPGIQVQDI
jgi:DNA polymerase III subunit alpha